MTSFLIFIFVLAYGQIRDADDRIALGQLSGKDTSYVTLSTGQTAQFGNLGNNFRLLYSQFGTAQGMCEDEKFYKDNKILGANCSGTLVGPNVILTAAHCLGDEPTKYCEKASYIFGATSKNIAKSFSKKNSFRTCKSIIATGGWTREADGDNKNKDWALVEMSSAVQGVSVAKIAPIGMPQEGESVYTIGTPQGIPAVKSTGRIVYTDKNGRGVKTDMDVVGGNSGGGVFNSKGEIIGVLTTSYEAGRIFFYEASGCARWSKESPVKENHDDVWVTGAGFIPIDYFRSDLEKYLKSKTQTEVPVEYPSVVQ